MFEGPIAGFDPPFSYSSKCCATSALWVCSHFVVPARRGYTCAFTCMPFLLPGAALPTRHVSFSRYFFSCILKKHLITDALITSCVAKGVLNIDITQRMDKEVDLDVTDDGIIKYCSSKIHVEGVRHLRLRGVNLEPLFVRDFLKVSFKV